MRDDCDEAVAVGPRILVAGDWHINFEWGDLLAQKARRLGIHTILQLGDFGIWPGYARPYFDTLENIAVDCGITIYAIGGNHEDYDQVAKFERCPAPDGFVTLSPHVRWIPRGHRWEWQGVRFGALGGAFSVDWRELTPGKSWWPDSEEVRSEDIERLGGEPLDVLVTHEAPEGAQPPFGQWDLEDDDVERARSSRVLVRQAVDATHPKLVLHGHWHVRNRATIEQPNGHTTQVEGFASDEEGDGTAWGVLDLRDLSFNDG